MSNHKNNSNNPKNPNPGKDPKDPNQTPHDGGKGHVTPPVHDGHGDTHGDGSGRQVPGDADTGSDE